MAQAQRDLHQQEVDANYNAIQECLDSIIDEHSEMFALMKDQKIIGFFDTRQDAINAGNLLYADGVFSAHKITREVVDLGIFSCI